MITLWNSHVGQVLLGHFREVTDRNLACSLELNVVLLLKAYLSEQLVEGVGMRDSVRVFLSVLLVLDENENSRQIVLFDIEQAEVAGVE